MEPLIVATEPQALILTELRNAHHRLKESLRKTAVEAGRAVEYANLDTLFLLSITANLPAYAERCDVLRQAAKFAGCSADEIKVVCQENWVSINYPLNAEAGT